MSAFEWMIALRYLRARRAGGFVSVIAGFSFLGIVLGVAALIVVMAVMNGFRTELVDKIIGLNGHMFLQGLETPLRDYEAVTARVAHVPGVKLALPLVEGQVFASTPLGQSGALARGVLERDIKRLPGVSHLITQGTLDGFDAQTGLALGVRLAERLGVQVGDLVTLTSPHGAHTAFGVMPRQKSYRVGAIFKAGIANFDAMFIFMPLAEAQAFFNVEGQVNSIEIYVEDPDHTDVLKARVDEAAQRPLIITDWRETNRTFFDVLAVELRVMFVILSLIVLVAALNIISGMTMLVQDKARAVAILRTMGATRGAILRIFLITGSAIGVSGVAVGLIFGLLVAEHVEALRLFINRLTGMNLFPAEIYNLSALPSRVEGGDVAAVVAMALTLSLLATLYPAWRAARLDPVEALRYE